MMSKYEYTSAIDNIFIAEIKYLSIYVQPVIFIVLHSSLYTLWEAYHRIPYGIAEDVPHWST